MRRSQDPKPCIPLRAHANPVWRCTVWHYGQPHDADAAKWDFVALHREDLPPEQAKRGLFTHGKATGSFDLSAPLDPGRYLLTAVRVPNMKCALAMMRGVVEGRVPATDS